MGRIGNGPDARSFRIGPSANSVEEEEKNNRSQVALRAVGEAIRKESLPPDLLEQIKAVSVKIWPYFNMTLNQFEIGSMWKMHAESEVAV